MSSSCLQGRTGGELAASYNRTDLTRVGKCVPAALKFSHSDPFEQPVEYFATVNQLAYGEPARLIKVSAGESVCCNFQAWASKHPAASSPFVPSQVANLSMPALQHLHYDTSRSYDNSEVHAQRREHHHIPCINVPFR